jgi:hypothetical protein
MLRVNRIATTSGTMSLIGEEWLSMWCVACGAEMRLVGVADTPMAGFERHTLDLLTCLAPLGAQPQTA